MIPDRFDGLLSILKALEQFLSKFKMSLFIVAAFPENCPPNMLT